MNRTEAKKLAAALVDRMTLEEAASQLRYDAPAIDRLGIPAYNWWNEALHGVARGGTATMFPQSIGLAATFDAPLLHEIADVIATEGRAKYNLAVSKGDRDIYKGLTFWSPNINIFRDPRWGRGHETYGEDPYLTSVLGVSFIKGLQGDGEYMKASACAKHLAVHSGPEAVRHSFDAVVSKKDMAETYLPAFEAAVKEGQVDAVMGAYNRVNGEPACGSKTLLADILRGQWGFEGHVVSDCWAIIDFHMFHGITDTAPESAALALENGCDMNCGVTYLHLLAAYQEGLVTEEMIRRSARRVMTTRYLLGLFDESCSYNTISPLENDTDAHAALAVKAAEESFVLLKNDGTLPLDSKKIKTLAVIGPNGDSRECLRGNYYGTSSRLTTFLSGLRRSCEEEGIRILYSEGSHLYKEHASSEGMANDRLAEAVTMASLADATVLCLGLDATLEGEQGDAGNAFASGDKENLELPEPQRVLLDALAKTGKPLITVVAAGSALRVEDGNAILYAWYPGQGGGTALAHILFGKTSPGGKLPLTFYKSTDDLPPFEDYAMEGRTYRYFNGVPLYPFGYGLSYTRFAFSDPSYKNGEACVRVKNLGDRAGDVVVQAYIQADEHPDETPYPRLCGFARVALLPGEEQAVSIPIPVQAFTLVNREGVRFTADGPFTLFIGESQPDERSAALMDGRRPLRITIDKP